MEKFPKSSKLDHVCYDIRGPVHKKPCNWKKKATKSSSSISATLPCSALKRLMKFWLTLSATCPLLKAIATPKVLFARKAIVHYYQTKGLLDVTVNDVYIGNGVSELITMSMQALLNDGDEIRFLHLTIHCGPPLQHWPAAMCVIISVTKKTTGSRIWPI